MSDGHSCCGHKAAVHSVQQSLDEMDFERGIWSAALYGEMDRVRSCLRINGDPNAVDSSGYTALHYAARNGHKDICEELLCHGASVNAATRSGGVTPLQRAAYCGHSSVVTLLLQKGADLKAQDNDGKTALHKACEKGHLSIVKQLLEADPECQHIADKKGLKPRDFVHAESDDLLQIFRNFDT